MATVIDLFAGAGGTGKGFVDAGFTVLSAVELSESAATTYSNNLKVPVLRKNISRLKPEAFRRRLKLPRGQLDVLAGCPPCQGFSRIRNGRGQSDERNALVLRYLEFVREFRPRFALFENVPGLIRSAHGQAFYDRLLEGLRALGYSPLEMIVDAVNFGVPQFRERVIVIAGDGCAPAALKETHANPKKLDSAPGSQRWATVRDAIGHLPPLGPGESDPDIPNHRAPRTGTRRDSVRIREFLKLVPVDGGSRTDVPREFWLPCHLKRDGYKDVYGRLAWDEPANTITGGCTNPSKGRFVHPEVDRGLTFREAAALQSFPDDYEFTGTYIAEQIGNAVPPRLARVVADALLGAL